MVTRTTVLAVSVAAAIGGTVVPRPVLADMIGADWEGVFSFLDPTGAVLSNTSIDSKTANSYQTPISGTLQFDTITGAGSATITPFFFLSNQPSLPFEAASIELQAVGDGMGGPGTLLLANMLFNWNGNSDIPASVVLDAAGFLGGIVLGDLDDGDLTQAEVAGYGATPATDGSYVGLGDPGSVTGPGGYAGYLGLGPVPIATTAWNTTLASGCDIGDCIGVSPSGGLPLVEDGFANNNDFVANTGAPPGTHDDNNTGYQTVYGIAGSPMPDGPFTDFSFSLDIQTMTLTPIPEVPLPAAVWLFGSGLLGIAGVARVRK